MNIHQRLYNKPLFSQNFFLLGYALEAGQDGVFSFFFFFCYISPLDGY